MDQDFLSQVDPGDNQDYIDFQNKENEKSI